MKGKKGTHGRDQVLLDAKNEQPGIQWNAGVLIRTGKKTLFDREKPLAEFQVSLKVLKKGLLHLR